MAAMMFEIAQWCSEGKLKPNVHAAYPLEKSAEAFKAIARRQVGKIGLPGLNPEPDLAVTTCTGAC